MKKETVLSDESAHIQSEIRALLTNQYSYDNGLKKQLNIISTVSKLRDKLSMLRREIQPGRPTQLN